jgi:hypothetical protein
MEPAICWTPPSRGTSRLLGESQEYSQGAVDAEHGIVVKVIKTAKGSPNFVARQSLRFINHHLEWLVQAVYPARRDSDAKQRGAPKFTGHGHHAPPYAFWTVAST